jgi:hypothetical protein
MNMKTSGIRTHLRKTIASLRWVSHVQGVYGDLTKHRRLDAGDKSHEYYNNPWELPRSAFDFFFFFFMESTTIGSCTCHCHTTSLLLLLLLVAAGGRGCCCCEAPV